ncbi:MAG: ribosomal-protein-alanine N-acetyltransferase [Methanocella sp. PtaU1.Bin125]|nr:MAG: ribosomal-protein-alanine N-acetyltransferase [Methanocella sp. PtaU1.Bin125]
MYAGPAEGRLELSTVITPAVEAAFEEAMRAMHAGDIERMYVRGLLDRARRGELFILALYRNADVAGAVCCRSVDGEAELVFGFLRPPCAGLERAFLEMIVAALARQGTGVVRSGFTWPGAGGFAAAAADMGFDAVRRISMALDVAGSGLFFPGSSPGVSVRPWSQACFEDTCRIMYEESEPSDRRVYPLFATPEGTRALLSSIVQDRHGTFLPGLSAVCEVDGRVAGVLLSALLADGSVLVLDIAVRKAYRRKGVASRMIEHLISRCAAAGKKQIVLAVTATNDAAIGLYKKMGFRQIATFDQHVLIIGPARSGV